MLEQASGFAMLATASVNVSAAETTCLYEQLLRYLHSRIVDAPVDPQNRLFVAADSGAVATFVTNCLPSAKNKGTVPMVVNLSFMWGSTPLPVATMALKKRLLLDPLLVHSCVATCVPLMLILADGYDAVVLRGRCVICLSAAGARGG